MEEIIYIDEDSGIHNIFKYDYIFIKQKDSNKEFLKDPVKYFYIGTIYNLLTILIIDNMPEEYIDYLVRLQYNIYNDAKFYKEETNIIKFFSNSISYMSLEYFSKSDSFKFNNDTLKTLHKNDKNFLKIVNYYKSSVSKKDITKLDYKIIYENCSQYLYSYLIIMFPEFLIEHYGVETIYKLLNGLTTYKYSNPEQLIKYVFNKDFKVLMTEFEKYLKNKF